MLKKLLTILLIALSLTTPVEATVLFSDDFNREDSDDLGTDWTERQGDFDIISNRAGRASGGSQNDTFYHDTAAYPSADYAVQADFQGAVAGVFGGIMGRRVNFSTTDSNGYICFINTSDGDVYSYRRVSGVYSNQGSGAAAFTGTTLIRTLRLEMEGSEQRCYVAGTLYVTTSNGTITATGDSGNTNYGVGWDNWLVETLEDAPVSSGTREDIIWFTED